MRLEIINFPTVSIVIPAYNAARTIGLAIDSILSQTFQDFELIICDDASTDSTQRIILSYTDTRIIYINNQVNYGPGLSRDRAIELVTGKWIAFTDADDMWLPERLERLLTAVEVNENVMVFDDIMECHDTPKGIVPWRVLRGQNAFGKNINNIPYEVFIKSKRLLIKPLIKSETIKKNNILHSNRSFAEDTEFFIKLMTHGIKLRYVPTPMYLYRITPNSASSTISRSTIMKEVLINANPLFSKLPAVQAALRYKISQVARDEQYLPFLCSLKKGQLITSVKMIFSSPWLLIEFLNRLTESTFYQIHRLLNGGRVRGTH